MPTSIKTVVSNPHFPPISYDSSAVMGLSADEPPRNEEKSSRSDILLQRVHRMLVPKEEKLRIIQNTPPDRIPELPIDTFSELNLQEAKSLTVDKMQKLTARQIFAIPTWTLQHLSPQQVASISLESWRELPKNIIKDVICPKSVIREEYLKELSEDQISVISEDWFQYFTPNQIREFSPSVFKELSSNRLNQLKADSIRAISQDQLSGISRKTLSELKEDFCLSLTDDQIKWMDDKVSEIAPSIFRNFNIQRVLGALNYSQIYWLTVNQLRAVSAPAFRQLIYNMFQQGRSIMDFVGGLRSIQLRCLKPEQISAFDIPGRQNVLISFDLTLQYFFLPKYQLQKFTQGELQQISSLSLHMMGDSFLNKLTPQQINWFTPQQWSVSDVAHIEAAHMRLPQPDTLWQNALRNLPAVDQIAELGYEFPTNLDPEKTAALNEKIATLKDGQLRAMTAVQIRAQDPSFFAALVIQGRFAILTSEQRQAIQPEIYSRLGMCEFLGMLYPLLLGQRRHVVLYHQQYQQFVQIVGDFTKEQVGSIRISTYRMLGDHFLCHLRPGVLSHVPEEAFRYVGEDFVASLTPGKAQDLTVEQIRNIKPEVFFRNLKSGVLSRISPEAFRYATEDLMNHLTPQQAANLTAEQVCKMKPAVFALVPERVVSHLSLEVCENLPQEHFQLLKWHNVHYLRAFRPEQIAKLPANIFSNILIPLDIVQNLDPGIFTLIRAEQLNTWAEDRFQVVRVKGLKGRQLNRHSMWDLNREHLQNIPENVIGDLNAHTLNTLQMTQFRFLKMSQLHAISKRVLQQLLELNSPIIEYCVNKKILTQ